MERLMESFRNLRQLRFRNGAGRTLALQIFRISHLINAETLKCARRETK